MGSAVLAMDQYEVVDKLGFRYQITKLGASDFATIIAGAQKRSNWVRCVDPLHEKHHVTEGGWQGAYNVRFIERLDPRTQAVIGYKNIWSAPKHSSSSAPAGAAWSAHSPTSRVLPCRLRRSEEAAKSSVWHMSELGW